MKHYRRRSTHHESVEAWQEKKGVQNPEHQEKSIVLLNGLTAQCGAMAKGSQCVQVLGQDSPNQN